MGDYVETIPAGSGFQDIFPQCSDISGRKQLSGYFPTMFEKFRREAVFRIFSHNVRTILAGSGFEDIFPQCSDNSGGKRL